MKSNFEIMTSLQYQVKILRARVQAFESGDKYIAMGVEHKKQLSDKTREIKKLTLELSNANSRIVTVRKIWSQTIDDLEAAQKKELLKKNRSIKLLEDKVFDLERQLDDARIKLREKNKEIYEVKVELEEEQGKNQKLRAQLNRDYENSSVPSSMKPNRKKITNNREKTDRKPGGQPGHEGHLRKKHVPTNHIFIPPLPEFSDSREYKQTGRMISKQTVNLRVLLDVCEYYTPEYRQISTGKRVYAPFPDGLVNEVSYGGSVKAFAYLLNNNCMVSIDKVREFLSEITNGALQISKGMINGLSREFSEKTEREKRKIFAELQRSPVMNVDFSTMRINGKNTPVLVCANSDNVMYFPSEHKGHEGVKGTPVEDYQGILVHDHDKTFYSYGSEHQECMSHILRYLKDSMENEPTLSWNRLMRELIREMIHYRNSLPKDAKTDLKEVLRFSDRYRKILDTAKSEYEYEPPSKYYKDGYNLYLRLGKYMDSHLLFLHNHNVPATNNLAERLLRPLKRKTKQVMTFRSRDNVDNLCACMGVIASLRSQGQNLYQSTIGVFEQ